MRISMVALACFLAAGVTAAPLAFADDAAGDASVKAEIEALKRKVAEQERKLSTLEANAPSQTELDAAISHYMASAPKATFVAGDGGKAGFPLGKKPFISEGPNKVNFIFRNQVRYSAFLYSSDAVGTVGNGASPEVFTITDEPRDRSGFEIERLYFGIEGSVFCDAITYQVVLNFDSDSGGNVEKEFLWLDYKYTGEHHVRAGTDKVAATYEEQNSSGSLAFADRSIYTKAFGLDSDTGVMLWGNFGGCNCPKAFQYKLFASTGEGVIQSAGSVFNTDARDTYSDQPLISGYLEWTPTCDNWSWDEVDHRSCEDRCKLQASIGVWGYYENDDDTSHITYGLALRSSGRLERSGFGAWARARWQGWNGLLEWGTRSIDYTGGSTAPDQTDSGATALVHYRFAESNWGVGARASVIWLDDDYKTITVGANPPVSFDDTITEYGFVVNYFFWDHNNKVTADISWVTDNSAVSSSSAGYLANSASKGVLVEDGVMVRVQWQLQF